jgi:hypothetical protein
MEAARLARSRGARAVVVITLSVVLACVAPFAALASPGNAPSRVRVSAPQWIIPAANLPPGVTLQAGNNNVAIAFHEGRLFVAWRTAPNHFASASTRIYVMSSGDMGRRWVLEREVFLGTDIREPFLVSFKGKLILTFFQAGTNPLAFEPQHMWRTVRTGPRLWSELEKWGEDGEVPWAFKVHDDRVWLTTYKGQHYGVDPGTLDLRFFVSDDGLTWRPVGANGPAVYTGGVSETGFEFDREGNLWAVTRNEDGDATGFGSHVAMAPAGNLGAWRFPAQSDPWRYDSPRLFRHGDDIYMVARRDPCSPYDMGWNFLPFSVRRLLYLAFYSLRPKRTALYRIDRSTGKVVWLQDLPGVADTAFPSIVQTGPHAFLVANYTSPLWYTWGTWLGGQISPFGTQIYFVRLDFTP